jgi:arsenite methyltransferase
MKSYLNTSFDDTKMTGYLDELPLWSAPFGLELLDRIEYKKNMTVLDIGFGLGFPLTELALRLGDSSVVYGIDPWKEAIERVRRKIEVYGINNIRIIEGVAESIPLADGSVDLITSNNGINNVSDPEKVLSECGRIIRQGGQFIQTMNTGLTMFEFYGQLEQVLLEFEMHDEIEAMHRHIEQKRPPVDKMVSLLQKSGFVIKDLIHDQFSYRFADGTTLLNHYFIRYAFMKSWIELLPQKKTEEIFNRVEERLNEQCGIAGGIQLSIPFMVINAIKK